MRSQGQRSMIKSIINLLPNLLILPLLRGAVARVTVDIVSQFFHQLPAMTSLIYIYVT